MRVAPLEKIITILYHIDEKKARRTERAFDNLQKKGYNMLVMKIFLIVSFAIALLIALTAWICFYMAFYSPKRKPLGKDEYEIPDGVVYEPYREVMVGWMKETRAMSYETLSVRTKDGLTLRGKYYEYEEGAPIELMFHGYRGTSERDLCGGVQRCFKLGRSALVVDQRASGESDGRVITFGLKESEDCVAWIDLMIRRFGKDVKVFLTGISMGAATVMIAAGKDLPENVVGVVADCGYSSAKEIIKKVIRDMRLPADLLYPFVRLGGLVYGRFDIEKACPKEALKNCRLPIIFAHGETDDFVPCDMSRENFEACASEKKWIYTVANAGHGLSFILDKEGYIRALREAAGEYENNC